MSTLPSLIGPKLRTERLISGLLGITDQYLSWKEASIHTTSPKVVYGHGQSVARTLQVYNVAIGVGGCKPDARCGEFGGAYSLAARPAVAHCQSEALF